MQIHKRGMRSKKTHSSFFSNHSVFRFFSFLFTLLKQWKMHSDIEINDMILDRYAHHFYCFSIQFDVESNLSSEIMLSNVPIFLSLLPFGVASPFCGLPEKDKWDKIRIDNESLECEARVGVGVVGKWTEWHWHRWQPVHAGIINVL